MIAEMVMKMMLTMLNSSVGKTGGVQDDAISTVGVVIQGGCEQWVWSFKVGGPYGMGMVIQVTESPVTGVHTKHLSMVRLVPLPHIRSDRL